VNGTVITVGRVEEAFTFSPHKATFSTHHAATTNCH